MQMKTLDMYFFFFCFYFFINPLICICAARKLDKQYSKSSVNNISLTCAPSTPESWVGQAAFVLSECTLDRQLVSVCGQ